MSDGQMRFDTREDEIDMYASNTITKGKWHHVALTGDGTNIRMFLDGKLVASDGAVSYTVGNGIGVPSGIPADAATAFNQGPWSSWYNDTSLPQHGFNGYISDFRISHVCRYTEDFVPPYNIQTNGAHSTGYVISSTWDTTTTTVGVPGYTPKFGISSAVFDGDGDKLTVAADDSFTFAENEDYTIEGWVKTDQVVGTVTSEADASVITSSDGTQREYEIDGVSYVSQTFTGDGSYSFTVSETVTADVMVLAGGGGGGGGYYNSGGGGAGGLRQITGHTITAGTHTVVVGAGGAAGATGVNGGNSSFMTISATGGGGGATHPTSGSNGHGQDGGSAGGSSQWNASGYPTSGGNAGDYDPPEGYFSGLAWWGGATGGGGAGGVGFPDTQLSTNAANEVAGHGGPGVENNWSTGENIMYGGGGGGSYRSGYSLQGSGGSGVGGDGGGSGSQSAGQSAVANTGSGGGGGWHLSGGAGSGGVVVIRLSPSEVDSPPKSIITTGTTGLKLGSSGYLNGCESVSGTDNYIYGTAIINDDVWHHVAISRNTGITRLFVDGVLQTQTRASTEEFVNSGVIIGSDSSDNHYSGSMDDIRITKGVGRYTENFTAPVLQNGDVLQVGDVIPVTDDIYYTGGKVGFGTTNPDYTVDVTGSVNTTGGFYENGLAVETLKRTDAGDAQYDGNVEVTGNLKVDSWTIKEENGNLILVKSDGTKYNINLTEI